MIEILAQVTGKHRGRPFAAGIVLWDDKVVVTSPILRRALAGRAREQVRAICQREGWTVEVVHRLERPAP